MAGSNQQCWDRARVRACGVGHCPVTTMKIPTGKVRNRPTELGREFGEQLARLCDNAEATTTTLHPRCATCAFRAGTLPNGCEATLMDALKCAMEGDTKFMCHERKGHACSGWLMMRSDKNIKLPWPFSDELPEQSTGDGERP